MSELIIGILALAFFAGLGVLAYFNGRIQAAVHVQQEQEKQQRALLLDPTYQAALEAEHRRDMQRRELHLKELQAALQLYQLPTPQYGGWVHPDIAANWVQVAPIHKPLQIKAPDDAPGVSALPGALTFSQVLASFQPSVERILLGYLPADVLALASAEGLCHVALAGATGGGKSSLIRLLMAQLCYVGATVLLLNPHYTRYDLRSSEDWTPFEPYLYADPMQCRDYQRIAYYLRYVAEEMLTTRLERYARSLPVGKLFYIVLDELPAIVKHIPEAPGWMADLLREGRKVGLFLVTAAQDFLVKTVAKDEGGAIRDCFRTAVYVGGDPTTARTLLDVKGTVDDGGLGQGVVMLRCQQVKQAQLARVPYVDNPSLYQLLGPSTYEPSVDGSVTVIDEPGERRETDFPGRHDAGTMNADPSETEAEEALPANVTTMPKRAVEPDEKQEEAPSTDRQKYNLTDAEITGLLAAYRASGSKEKAAAAIGKTSSNYRPAINRVLRAYGLIGEEA
jgi:hypothetical protein